ncbi:MAG TPA: HEAT repeat domain-containing protein, partial [Kofleriaceae bacterium]
AAALGELHDAGSFGVLAGALALHDDRLVGDAAWALGELATTAPAQTGSMIERLLYLGRHGSWAASIDATAAIARTLWATPRDARAALVTGDRRAALVALAANKSRLVRINAISALAALGQDDAIKVALAGDASPHVRAAAATALGRIGDARTPAIAAALDAAQKDPVSLVATAARAASAPGAHAIPARSEWRTFYVVDPSSDDARVREQPYFIDGPDDLIWATYTDPRGEITSEHVPAGVDRPNVWASSRESEY